MPALTSSIPMPTSPKSKIAPLSTSPSTAFPIHQALKPPVSTSTSGQPRILHPIATDEFRLLLLENINQSAVESFRGQVFQVDCYSKALTEDELVQKIGAYHAIGIRSKTKLTERVIRAASKVRAFSKMNFLDLTLILSYLLDLPISYFSSSL